MEKFPDILLVTVGYRTGIMGFMDFSSVPGGENFASSGNLGILDQICALKWIQKNIKAFGGNPDNVTIFGESAGGGSVSLLPLIEGTKGLFHRIIAESGSVCQSFSREESRYRSNLNPSDVRLPKRYIQCHHEAEAHRKEEDADIGMFSCRHLGDQFLHHDVEHGPCGEG